MRISKYIFISVLFLACAAGTANAQMQRCLQADGSARQVMNWCRNAIESWHGEYPVDRLAEAHIILGQSQMMDGDLIAAYGNAEKALSLAPDNITGRILLARIHMRNNNFSRAEVEINKAMDSATNDQDKGLSFYHLAILYRIYGQNSRANNILTSARTFFPQYFDVYQWELGQFQNVIYQAREADKAFETGKRQMAGGNIQGAIKMFELALSSSPANATFRNWLGAALVDNKEYQVALNILNETPDNLKWNYFIALCYLNLEQFDRAIAYFEAAKRDKPPKNRGVDAGPQATKAIEDIEKYQALFRKGQVEFQNENYAEAIKFAQAAKAIVNSKDADGLEKLAQTSQEEKLEQIRKQKQGNIIMVVVFLSLIGLVFAVYLLKYFKNKAMLKANIKMAQDIAALPALDSFNAYLDYRMVKPEEVDRVVDTIIPTIANSLNYQLVQVFMQEIPPYFVKKFLMHAGTAFINTGDPVYSTYGLSILNQIPFDQWKKDEIAPVFMQGHLNADATAFNAQDSMSQSLWNENIPVDIYHMLLDYYYKNQQYQYVTTTFQKLPSYIWGDSTWAIYMDSQAKTGGLVYLNPENVVRKYQPMLVKELFHHGLRKRITDFLKVLSMATWSPDYFVYLFYFAVQDSFSDALQHYDNLRKNFDLAAATKQFYLIAIMCEKAGHYEQATEIYSKFLTLDEAFEDANSRNVKIGRGDYSSISPTPDEVLYAHGIYIDPQLSAQHNIF